MSVVTGVRYGLTRSSEAVCASFATWTTSSVKFVGVARFANREVPPQLFQSVVPVAPGFLIASDMRLRFRCGTTWSWGVPRILSRVHSRAWLNTRDRRFIRDGFDQLGGCRRGSFEKSVRRR